MEKIKLLSIDYLVTEILTFNKLYIDLIMH